MITIYIKLVQSITKNSPLTPKQRWEKIAQFKFPDHFRELLCKKLDWQMSSAQNAIIEYRKFMYLATYSPVTPSLVIDEVWHLHIQWTSLYAEFCQDIYSDNFCHHLPEFLPPQDGISDFQPQYYETLKLYYCEFNCHPPKSIWSYNLKEGVKLKLEGRAIPLSAEPFWKTIPFLLSPVFNQAVIKAKTKQYSSSSFILNQDVNQKKYLRGSFLRDLLID